MAGYDDPTGGLPPLAGVDPLASYPAPAWLPDAAMLPPPPPPSPGAPAFGPQLDGSFPQALPDPVPSPVEAAANGLPPPPLTDEFAPPPMPWGAAPGTEAAADAPAFGPQPPTTIAGSGLVETPTIEDKSAAPPPFLYQAVPGDPNAALPSLRDATISSPFVNLTDDQAYGLTEKATPQELERLNLSHKVAQETKANFDRAKADHEDLEALKLNMANREAADVISQKKNDQIAADSVALSKRPLDRGRWFKNLSTFQKVMAGIAAITGGLISKPGGPNLGVDFVTKHIDDDINDQKADIENERTGLQARQGAVAQEFAKHKDMFQAVETVRMASRQALLNQLETARNDLDPRGSTFIEYGKYMQQLRGNMAAQDKVNRKEESERAFKAIGIENDLQKTADARWKDQHDAALADRKERREGAAAKAPDQIFTPQQLAGTGENFPAPPIPMTMNQYGHFLETKNKGEEFKAKARANDPNQIDRELAVPGITDSKGDLVRFASAPVADAIGTLKGNAAETVRLTDELINLVEEHGAEADFLKSPAWQQMHGDFASILLKTKENDHLGALSGSDIDLELKKIGSSDPTQIRNTVPGLRQFRRNVVEGVNSTLQNKAVVPPDRKLARWNPPDASKMPKTPETPEESRWKELTRKSDESFEDAARDEIGKRRTALLPSQLGDPQFADQATREGLAAARATFNPDVSRKQQKFLGELAAEARGPIGDPTADRARKRLTDLEGSANNVALRDMATAALREAADAASLSSDESTSAPEVRGVSHETVPSARGRR